VTTGQWYAWESKGYNQFREPREGVSSKISLSYLKLQQSSATAPHLFGKNKVWQKKKREYLASSEHFLGFAFWIIVCWGCMPSRTGYTAILQTEYGTK
jgi:hypothetical protein